MARLLCEREGAGNLMRVRDPVSGASVGLIFRLPTTAERVDYFASLLRRENDDCVSALIETRRRFGLALLCGLAEGDFALPGEGAAARPVSSEPGSPHFEPRWRELIEERAPELAEALAYHVFEGHYGAPERPAVGEASKKK
jgi:hypothetical protein